MARKSVRFLAAVVVTIKNVRLETAPTLCVIWIRFVDSKRPMPEAHRTLRVQRTLDAGHP